ncbi:MAG: hypothetical protein ACO1OB_00940 [Archangium sp.]
MSSLLSCVALVGLVSGATQTTVSFDALDGGLEVGAATAPVAKTDAGFPSRAERQRLIFSYAERSPAEIADDPNAPLIELVSDGLRNVQLANTKRKRPVVEVHAVDLIALLPRMEKSGDRKRRAQNMALWLERQKTVDETEAALVAMSASAEVTAFQLVRKTFSEGGANSEPFIKAVDALAANEATFKKKLDGWLRDRLKAGELPLREIPEVQGKVLTRHAFKITDVTPRDDGLYFLSWDDALGVRRTLEKLDADGARSVVIRSLDVSHEFQPWHGGWAWVDSRGTIRSVSVDGEKEELSFPAYSVRQFHGSDDVNVLVLARRREAPKRLPEWVLASWVREQAPVVLAHGAGSAQVLGVRDGRAVVRAGADLILFSLADKTQPPTRVGIPEGATYWLDGRVVLNANPLMQTAQFQWLDLKTGKGTTFADAPLGIVTQEKDLLRLTAGFKKQQLSVIEGPGKPLQLGEWTSVLGVSRVGNDFIVTTWDPAQEFGAIARVARPGP